MICVGDYLDTDDLPPGFLSDSGEKKRVMEGNEEDSLYDMALDYSEPPDPQQLTDSIRPSLLFSIMNLPSSVRTV